MLAPEAEKRVYDGCCGSGGMFIQSEKCIKLDNWGTYQVRNRKIFIKNIVYIKTFFIYLLLEVSIKR
jgi:type I restriction-modification system DNA methylase subunit